MVLKRTPYGGRSRLVSAIALVIGIAPILGTLYLRLGGVNPLGGLEDCRFQMLFGFPAPSCGLTRSFIALLKGNMAEAITYHLFGPILFFGLALCAMQGLAELSLRQPFPVGYRWAVAHGKSTRLSVLVLAIAFLVYYAIRLYARYHLVASSFDQALLQGFVTGAHLL